jgi:tetratricopeptide (TPR) repeat protein
MGPRAEASKTAPALKNAKAKGKTKSKESTETLELKAEELKNAGNKCFSEGDIPGALQNYTSGIDQLSSVLKLELNANQMRVVPDASGKSRLKIQRLLAVLHSNRAQVYLKMSKFSSALDDTNVSLVHEPAYAKAMLRKAQALCGLKEYEHAIAVLTEAAAAVPSEKQSFQALLETVHQQYVTHQREEAKGSGAKETKSEEQQAVDAATAGIDEALGSMEETTPEFQKLMKDMEGAGEEQKGGKGEGGQSMGGSFVSAAGAIVLEDWHVGRYGGGSVGGAAQPESRYRWRQTFDELTLVFPVAASVNRRQIRCTFKPKHICVKVGTASKGAGSADVSTLLEDVLCGPVHIDECSWVLEDAGEEERALWGGEAVKETRQLVVYLGKATVGERAEADVWAGLVRGGETIDTGVLAIDQRHQAQKLQRLNASARSGMKSSIPKSLAASAAGAGIFEKLLNTPRG